MYPRLSSLMRIWWSCQHLTLISWWMLSDFTGILLSVDVYPYHTNSGKSSSFTALGSTTEDTIWKEKVQLWLCHMCTAGITNKTVCFAVNSSHLLHVQCHQPGENTILFQNIWYYTICLKVRHINKRGENIHNFCTIIPLFHISKWTFSAMWKQCV